LPISHRRPGRRDGRRRRSGCGHRRAERPERRDRNPAEPARPGYRAGAAAPDRGARTRVASPGRHRTRPRRGGAAAGDPRVGLRRNARPEEDGMTYRSDLFIDGEWRPGASGERFDVVDPADLSTVARFAVATAEDCDAAVDAAASAQPGWGATPPRERGELLRAVFESLRSDAEELASVIVAENGKSWAD